MIFKDYYKIIGLETNRVSLEEVKIAFREKAKQYHPDVNVSSRAAEERFKDINEAYRTLSDGSVKRKYDRKWNSYIGKRQAQTREAEEPRNIFTDARKMFFGENKSIEVTVADKDKKVKKQNSVKGENIETEIDVMINEAFHGEEKKVALRTVDGKMKTFAVKIPSGIRNGEKIRLLGQGKAGQFGGKNGDLFIKVKIDDTPEFRLEGCDIVTDLCLAPWEAALGKRVNISTIDETVSLYIPPGVQSGEKIKIPNKGYKDGQGGRGNLIAEVKTVVPKKLSSEEKELFERLAHISTFKPRVG